MRKEFNLIVGTVTFSVVDVVSVPEKKTADRMENPEDVKNRNGSRRPPSPYKGIYSE